MGDIPKDYAVFQTPSGFIAAEKPVKKSMWGGIGVQYPFSGCKMLGEKTLNQALESIKKDTTLSIEQKIEKYTQLEKAISTVLKSESYQSINQLPEKALKLGVLTQKEQKQYEDAKAVSNILRDVEREIEKNVSAWVQSNDKRDLDLLKNECTRHPSHIVNLCLKEPTFTRDFILRCMTSGDGYRERFNLTSIFQILEKSISPLDTMVTFSQIQRETTLEIALKNSQLSSLFLLFAVSEYSEENVLSWMDIEVRQSVINNPNATLPELTDCYNHFESNKNEINISNGPKKILEQCKANIAKHELKELRQNLASFATMAQKELILNLTDTYSRAELQCQVFTDLTTRKRDATK